MVERKSASETQTIDYYRLYKDAEGHIRVLCIQLEEARKSFEFLNGQNDHLTDKIKRQEALVLQLMEKLKDFAVDELTGLAPLAVFDSAYAQVIRDNFNQDDPGSDVVTVPAALLVLDMDQFCQINEVHGRAFGDHILKFVGRIISSRIRNCDKASRYDGQRFAILLPKCPLKVAVQKAREISQRLTAENFAENGKEEIRVTATIGICMYQRKVDRENLVKKAEVAMHFGKDQGRYCTVVYKEGGGTR